jgi:ABC-type nitrate/sulfonate/bicarbonate transport system ATPase subunit
MGERVTIHKDRMSKRAPILQLKSLTKSFGTFNAVDGIDLDIAEGEFFTIVGPSGSGKTTLIRMLAGMEQATGGDIILSGTRINDLPANKRPTCMVFQSLALFPHRTVGENIEFPLKIKGIDPAQRKKRALALLDQLRLPRDYYGKSVLRCSGGERQRVALARALAFDPKILFFDEPLSAIDYKLRKTLEKELKDIHRETGKTFVYITHSIRASPSPRSPMPSAPAISSSGRNSSASSTSRRMPIMYSKVSSTMNMRWARASSIRCASARMSSSSRNCASNLPRSAATRPC